MIRRINYYLLTHYPMLWNTRLLWVAITNITLHLLFLTAGLFAIDAGSIAGYYSVSNVGGGNQYTLSILCGLVVLIVWCIFYLRNNAFKNYYRIGKWYLAKEFAIICLILFSSLSYFMSFDWGVRARVRSITGEAQMIQEINIVNKATVYIPNEKTKYFILNTCVEKKNRRLKDTSANTGRYVDDDYVTDYYGSEHISTIDSAALYQVSDSASIREALRRAEAFSYLNYCNTSVKIFYPGVDTPEQVSQRNQTWLLQARKDSVKAALQNLFGVLNKYNLRYRVDADSIVRDVFSDSTFSMNTTISASRFFDRNGYQVEHTFYLNNNEVNNVFSFIEDCHPGGNNYEDRMMIRNLVGYLALSLSILLLCYRRFSRKVFLISIIGTLVWAILFGLLAVSMNSSTGFAVMVLLLCGIFLSIGLTQLWQNKSKSLSGVMLNWHVYLAPYVVLLIASIIVLNLSNYNQYTYVIGSMSYDDYLQFHYPFSYWVKEHLQEIFFVNLGITFLYMAFVFNRWARRWQLMPDE